MYQHDADIEADRFIIGNITAIVSTILFILILFAIYQYKKPFCGEFTIPITERSAYCYGDLIITEQYKICTCPDEE